MIKQLLFTALFSSMPVTSLFADSFAFTFTWGDIPICTSGQPNQVENPTFKLSNVPEGTRYLYFNLTDKNVPTFQHGGGIVEFTGQAIIEPGAFKYLSPCPPSGRHTYEWKATAKSKKSMFGGKLGSAKASVDYPE